MSNGFSSLRCKIIKVCLHIFLEFYTVLCFLLCIRSLSPSFSNSIVKKIHATVETSVWKKRICIYAYSLKRTCVIYPLFCQKKISFSKGESQIQDKTNLKQREILQFDVVRRSTREIPYLVSEKDKNSAIPLFLALPTFSPEHFV